MPCEQPASPTHRVGPRLHRLAGRRAGRDRAAVGDADGAAVAARLPAPAERHDAVGEAARAAAAADAVGHDADGVGAGGCEVARVVDRDVATRAALAASRRWRSRRLKEFPPCPPPPPMLWTTRAIAWSLTVVTLAALVTEMSPPDPALPPLAAKPTIADAAAGAAGMTRHRLGDDAERAGAQGRDRAGDVEGDGSRWPRRPARAAA